MSLKVYTHVPLLHKTVPTKISTANSQNALREFHDVHLLEVASELREQVEWPAEQE